MIRDLDIQKCVELIREADCVLIGAGSGITVDAGYNYADQEAFARDYPGMVKLGFRMKAELIGYTGWSPALKWGYLAAHVNEVRFEAPPHPVYGRLLDLVKDKDYFVITSWIFQLTHGIGPSSSIKALSIPFRKRGSYTDPKKVPINSLISSCVIGPAT